MIRTALRFMRFDRPKSIGITVGIVISIFLIGQQLSTLQFIVEIMSGLITNSNPGSGEVWVIENTTGEVNKVTPIDSRLIREIRSIEGVETTHPIIVSNSSMTMKDGQVIPVIVVGSDAPSFAGGPSASRIFKGDIRALSNPGAISADFFDAKSMKANLDPGTTIEINGQYAQIALQTRNAQAFGGHYMFTSMKNARSFTSFPEDKVSIITVKTRPGVQTKEVIQRINRTFYGVKAWDKEKLRNSTANELLRTTNMGVSFGALVVFAIITGFFIIGLTLYSSTLDRIRDYGTFKAIGATNGYVRKLILTQAIIYAGVGLAIALILLYFFKNGVANAGLIVKLSPGLLLFLFAVTMFISIGGSLFAIRKINKLEPASVFK